MAGEGAVTIDPDRLRGTLDAMREGLQILGRDWRYLYVNEAVARHGRRSREELLGRTMLECYPGIEKTPLFATLERCMRERAADVLENEFQYPDGARAWFELRIQPCPEGLLVLSMDVTERKRLLEALTQAEKLRALGQLASGVAHDLKNILNPLGLHLALLRRRLRDLPETHEILDQMAGVITRGNQTIDLLRDFGRQAPVRSVSPVDLGSLAQEAAQLCRSRQAQPGGPVEITVAIEGEPRVRVSAPELLSALVNLLVNAIEALAGPGHIVVRTGADEREAWIEVEDDGPGMTPEVEARAFEPFFTTKGDAGTGLGLAMVYAFVARHDGRVRVRTAPGAGTAITLLFPAVVAAAAEG
jgi:PAS domain S-box-containing protein